MQRKIIVNSLSSGKFREQVINGRPHLITSMVSLSLDSVMNGLFYPAAVIRESYQQLDRVLAPASHPLVDGLFLSARDPVAVNAHNVGAFALNPRIEGRHVINDLAVDIGVAEKDERGVEVLRRIRNNEQIGVSTGLNGSMVLVKGQFDGERYDGILNKMEFDHVALLLDEAPAGASTFTLNSSNDADIVICNLDQSVNELRDQLTELAREQYGNDDSCCYVYVVDVELDPNFAIADVNDKLWRIPFALEPNGKPRFTGAGVEVRRVVTFEANGRKPAPTLPTAEGRNMDKEKLVLAIIGNSANSFSVEDKAYLETLSEVELMNKLHGAVKRPDITADQAREVCEGAGMVVNAATDAEAVQTFMANRAAFEAFQATQAEERATKSELIVNNSDMTADDVGKLDDAALDRLANSLQPSGDFSGQGNAPVRRAAGGGNAPRIDFSY